MTYLDTYNNAVSSINNADLLDDIITYIIKNKQHIVTMIRQRWLLGAGVNGDIIGGYRDREYQQMKQLLNPKAGGNVDLTLTGSLGDNLTLKAVLNGVEVISTDYKFAKLAQKYGSNQFNITAEEQIELENFIVNDLILQITSAIWN